MSRTTEIRKLLDRNQEEVETRITTGIEANRKGRFRLTVTDAQGTPLPDVRLTLTQLDHEFVHGANLFMLDQLETEEKNQKYRSYFAESFNLATLAFYWNTLEPEQGKPRFHADSPFVYRRPPVDPCLTYCRAHGITPKAHCLNYDRFTPEWLLGADTATIKRRLVERFALLAERYRDEIPCWEVVNELLCHNGATRFYDDPEVVEWSFQLARRFFLTNELMINETNPQIFGAKLDNGNRDPYYMLVERSLRNGAPIDSIGIQFHMFRKKELELAHAKDQYDLLAMLRILDQLARLGKPLQITEVTIPAYEETPEDYALQAEILRRLYRLWFSHPAMEGIIYWNLVDGYAWGATPGDMRVGENLCRGGLLDFQLRPKPAFNMVRDLFQKEWHTALTGRSDGEGVLPVHGFFGRYQVTLEREGEKKTVSLSLLKNGTRTPTLVF